MTEEGDSNSKGSNDSVFGDLCQRGREHEPKAKGPHHHLFFKKKTKDFQLVNFKLVSHCVHQGERVIFQN
jgi:hypothetical protein